MGTEDIGALIYDLFMWPLEKGWGRKWRARLWEGISGRVLEIGVGTGANIPYYPANAEVVAVDVGAGMLARAGRKAAGLGRRVELVRADVRSLPFADGDFDYVVGSFLFCSVEDPIPALREVGRVLATGGELRLLEHVRPRDGRLAKLLDFFVPHFAKRTWEFFPEADLDIVREEQLDSRGLVRLYWLQKSSERKKEWKASRTSR